MASTTRRDFLRFQMASGALFLGLPTLWRGAGRQDEEAGPPKALTAARKLMKEHGLWGVGIPVPADRKARRELGGRLETLVNGPSAELRDLLLEAVYVCVDPRHLDLQEGEQVVLMNDAGRRVAGSNLDLASPVAAQRDLAALLHASGRLEERAKAATTDRIAEALEHISEDPQALAVLAAAGRQAAPALIQGKTGAEAERKAWFDSVLFTIWHQLVSGDVASATRTLPYGVLWKLQRPPERDPCPTCGMAVMKDPTRQFVRFLRD